ncbi:hypothetical protein K466DRAFT_648875 [Polyporus arcularius HHB13444]|uniref:Actin-like ATPase domain-containing protein n=1 Tax=Polyporus arcularius HHB13444 TaxID=1314778 RepID=A0A5C3NP18_9APHY|nr:hypothetical protein K466DRAFT_648875 [Polyporus arcularius HHB13444]
MTSLHPYKGTCRKLVVGIDVGTTYSGVAYAILDPGEVPKIHGVTRFPGQENNASDSKVPSILYYRADGTVHSAGAEAAAPGMDIVAEDHGLLYVEWFKLHLRLERLDSNEIKREDLPRLPVSKTVTDVFADFLAYLYRYPRERDRLWTSLADRIEFILSHPNGWEGLQQGKMRQAAVMGGLIPNTAAGHARVHFVTEGEASLNFCIQNGLTAETLCQSQSVMIVDAGGGTIDISSYTFVSVSPTSVEEVTSADCILQGSTRVNLRAENFLKGRLKSSRYGNAGDIKSMLESFDKSTKPVFKDEKEPSYIKFGAMNSSDLKVNIRRGQLMLTGSEMVSFFQPSLDAIVKTVRKQRQEASATLRTVFLVGGFAASPWLYAGLKKRLNEIGMTLCRPDSHTNKAVAYGAVCFYLEHFVCARVMKMTYGTEVVVHYDRTDPEHALRSGSIYVRPSGRKAIRGGFSSILKKGTSVHEKDEISQPYFIESHHPKTLDSIVQDVLCYRGKETNPGWVDVEPELYTPLCTIYADTSQVKRQPLNGPSGVYYVQRFKIILLCGLTELKAQLSWDEDIVYDDHLRVSA